MAFFRKANKTLAELKESHERDRKERKKDEVAEQRAKKQQGKKP